MLLGKLGYNSITKVCPKERRGESYAYKQTFAAGDNTCEILAAGHNSKKPVLVVSTADTMAAADRYTKSWKYTNALGELRTFTIDVATTCVHALYHRFYGKIDFHNHLRQGLVSMADAWPTNDWVDRHFAEGLGFWEVNVYKALVHFHPDYKSLSHPDFRKRLAHAFLTLGKVAFAATTTAAAAAAAAAAAGPSSEHEPKLHKLVRFSSYKNEHHKCGFCVPASDGKQVNGYFYCITCFPDGQPTHALCNPTCNRPCYALHCRGDVPRHRCKPGIAKRRASPRLAAKKRPAEKRAAPPRARRSL